MAGTENPRVAVLSIHPAYALGIIEKRKTVEFRRRTFGSSVSHVVVYATAPVRKVLGLFAIAYIEEGSPSRLWEKHGNDGLIERQSFFKYFKNATAGVAIVIGEVHRLSKPVPLHKLTGRAVGPQSFEYVGEAELRRAGIGTIR